MTYEQAVKFIPHARTLIKLFGESTFQRVVKHYDPCDFNDNESLWECFVGCLFSRRFPYLSAFMLRISAKHLIFSENPAFSVVVKDYFNQNSMIVVPIKALENGDFDAIEEATKLNILENIFDFSDLDDNGRTFTEVVSDVLETPTARNLKLCIDYWEL